MLGAVGELVTMARITSSPRASARGEVAVREVLSPQALAHDRVIVVSRPRASGNAFFPLRAVVASVGWLFRQPWAGPCWLDILVGPTCSQGWLLDVWPIISFGLVGPCILVPRPFRRDDATVATFLSLCVVAAPDRGLS